MHAKQMACIWILLITLQITSNNACKFEGDLINVKTGKALTKTDKYSKTEYKDKNNEDMCVYSVKANGGQGVYISNDFTLKEYQSHGCGQGKDDLVRISPLLVKCVQNIRDGVGDSVTIMGAYRKPKHNKCRGGADGSRHLSGVAADIYRPKKLKTNEQGNKDFVDIAICGCRDIFFAKGYKMAMGLSAGNIHIDHRNSGRKIETWLYGSGRRWFKPDPGQSDEITKSDGTKKKRSRWKSKEFTNYIKNKKCDNSKPSDSGKDDGEEKPKSSPKSETSKSDWSNWWDNQKKSSWWGKKNSLWGGLWSAQQIDDNYQGFYDEYDENIANQQEEVPMTLNSALIMCYIVAVVIGVCVCFFCGLVAGKYAYDMKILTF